MTWEQEILYQRSEAFEEGAQQNDIANARNLLGEGISIVHLRGKFFFL